jgi:hypothetical protein
MYAAATNLLRLDFYKSAIKRIAEQDAYPELMVLRRGTDELRVGDVHLPA